MLRPFVPIPHPRWGETGVAFVVLTQEVADDELEQHCRAGLSRYKVPSRFIRLEQLPRNQTGKVVRRSLQSIAEDSLVKGSAT